MDDFWVGSLVTALFTFFGWGIAYLSVRHRETEENKRKRKDVLREKYEEILEAINFFMSSSYSSPFGEKNDEKKATTSINKIYLYMNSDSIKRVEKLQKYIKSGTHVDCDVTGKIYLEIINYMREELDNHEPKLEFNLDFKKYPIELKLN